MLLRHGGSPFKCLCISRHFHNVSHKIVNHSFKNTQDYQTRATIRDVEGLNPILELLKSEYAVIQKLALLALDRASQDGKACCYSSTYMKYE